MTTQGWIGVDLDGTLAEYHGWQDGTIGAPIRPMVERIRAWIHQGKTVKILTARAGRPADIPLIQRWLVEVAGLPLLEVTDRKDFTMIELWDDRAIQVEPNTGQPIARAAITHLKRAVAVVDEALVAAGNQPRVMRALEILKRGADIYDNSAWVEEVIELLEPR